LKMLGIAGPVAAEHRLAARNTAASKIKMAATGPAILPHSVFCLEPFIYVMLSHFRR